MSDDQEGARRYCDTVKCGFSPRASNLNFSKAGQIIMASPFYNIDFGPTDQTNQLYQIVNRFGGFVKYNGCSYPNT